MSAKGIFVEKLQREFRKKLHKLKDKQERQREQQKFTNILPLQSRSPERGPPFFLFIFLLPFEDLFQYLSLRKFLK